MSQTINVLFLAAEAEPFVKVGGLGDVAGTLPRALRALSNDEIKIDIRLVLPQHSVIKADSLRAVGIYSIPRGNSEVQAEAGRKFCGQDYGSRSRSRLPLPPRLSTTRLPSGLTNTCSPFGVVMSCEPSGNSLITTPP